MCCLINVQWSWYPSSSSNHSSICVLLITLPSQHDYTVKYNYGRYQRQKGNFSKNSRLQDEQTKWKERMKKNRFKWSHSVYEKDQKDGIHYDLTLDSESDYVTNEPKPHYPVCFLALFGTLNSLRMSFLFTIPDSSPILSTLFWTPGWHATAVHNTPNRIFIVDSFSWINATHKKKEYNDTCRWTEELDSVHFNGILRFKFLCFHHNRT